MNNFKDRTRTVTIIWRLGVIIVDFKNKVPKLKKNLVLRLGFKGKK